MATSEYGTMSSRFTPSDPSVLDQPGVAAWLSAVATASQKLADAPDEAALAAMLEQLVIPALGDLFALYTFESGGALQAVVAPDAVPTTALGRVHAHETRSAPATDGLAGIARAGTMLVQQNVSRSWLETLTEGPDHLALFQAVGFRSVVLVPIVASGESRGLLLLGSTDGARAYSDGAVSLIGLLARGVASALAARAAERRAETLNRRLEDLIQAARELAHLINNDLTLPVGALEILLDRPDHPPELREMLAAAATDLAAAEQHIHGFHDLARSEALLPPGRGQPQPPSARPRDL
jgi:GAF domain-containing protein